MRGLKLSAMVLVLALAACAKAGDDTDDAAANGGQPADAPAAAPAPSASATAGTPPQGATAEDVTAGQQLFSTTANCYTCHGPEAKGTQLAPNLTDAEWINISGSFDDIQTVIKKGVNPPKQHPAPMPEMGGAKLTDAQVKQLAAYVWSLGGGK